MLWKTRSSQRNLAHRVQRIRNNNQYLFRRASHNFIDDLGNNVGIGLQKIVAAHARFARQSRGDNYYVRVFRPVVSCKIMPTKVSGVRSPRDR